MSPTGNRAYHVEEPPTITGAICNVFFAILHTIGDVFKNLCTNITVEAILYIISIAVVWLGVSSIWKWLCSSRALKHTKAYVNCVNGWRGMEMALGDMWLLSSLVNMVYTLVMTLVLVLNTCQFLFWGLYAVFGSLICQLGTYTDAELKQRDTQPTGPLSPPPPPTQAPHVDPRVVRNQGESVLPGFNSAMRAIATSIPRAAVPPMRAPVSAPPVVGHGVEPSLAPVPFGDMDPAVFAQFLQLWHQTLVQSQPQPQPQPRQASDGFTPAVEKAVAEAIKIKNTGAGVSKPHARGLGRRNGVAAMDVEQADNASAGSDENMSEAHGA